MDCGRLFIDGSDVCSILYVERAIGIQRGKTGVENPHQTPCQTHDLLLQWIYSQAGIEIAFFMNHLARSKTNCNTFERLRCWDGKNRKAVQAIEC